ncbi:MAG: 4Fe-4S dicluster domain-containing protein [Fidelibacterota bacterium]|nr:MAG: 4Fe-4S dicluster domain-containing protein [Candidatus Neomarinimicrobiota bacterium]
MKPEPTTPTPLMHDGYDALKKKFALGLANVPHGDLMKRCLQCGTCTGSCPASYAMEITPREIVALFRADHLDTILQSRTIWICASCYACTVRCPQEIPITDIMYLLKRMAMDARMPSHKMPVYRLSQIFVSIANRFGRGYELGLLLRYYLGKNPFQLIANLPLFLKLFLKGRIGLWPHKIRGTTALSSILAEAEIMEMIIPVREWPR